MTRRSLGGAIAGLCVVAVAGIMFGNLLAQGRGHVFTEWSAAMNVERDVPGTDPALNTSANDGCPTLARDGRTMFIASNRTGTLGGQDIWIVRRDGQDDPWGEPTNVG